MNQTKPGFNPIDQHNSEWPDMTDKIVDFMAKEPLYSTILDIGDRGYKSISLSKIWEVTQLHNDDFNIPTKDTGLRFHIVTCFEMIEHIQNPLLFFSTISKYIVAGGTIYLSTPHRPKFLWPPYHFNEMSSNHLEKWILKPCGFKIVRKKRLRITDGIRWYYPFTGIRPFLRWFFWNYTWIYEIKQN